MPADDFWEWQDSYRMCQHGSGFALFSMARGLGSKYSAFSSISICVDRVDMNRMCTEAWAQRIPQQAVHRIQGAKMNYRSLKKNNNPPLLFPLNQTDPVYFSRAPTGTYRPYFSLSAPLWHPHCGCQLVPVSYRRLICFLRFFCTALFVLFLFAETLSVDKKIQKNCLGFHFLLQRKQKEQNNYWITPALEETLLWDLTQCRFRENGFCLLNWIESRTPNSFPIALCCVLGSEWMR